MAHISRLGALGIGVEAIAGTPVAATHWLQFTKGPTLTDKYEYENIKSARGRVEASQGTKLMKTYGEGNVEVILDDITSVIPFGMILGSVSSASAGASIYDHTISVNNSNTPKTATVIYDRVTDTRTFTNAVIEKLDIKVADGFAEMTMALKSREGATGSASESYVTVANFNFKDLSVKFGVDVAGATSASPTPLSGVDLSIKRTVAMAYQTGQNYPQNFSYETLEVTGNYSLLFESTTERDKYLANTANAMILTFTNGANSVKITLPNVRLNNWSPSNDIDKEVSQSADFEAHYDTTAATSISAVIRNTVSSYLNLSV